MLILKFRICSAEVEFMVATSAVRNEGNFIWASGPFLSLSRFTLKRGARIEGNLGLSGPYVRALPKCMTVCGDFYIHNARINILPEGLTVIGNLIISHTPLEAWPHDLWVGGNIYLADSA